MTDPRYAPTTHDGPAGDPAQETRDAGLGDERPAISDEEPTSGDERPASGTDPRTETDTHTAALQGAAAGGAMGGNAGYAGGLMTGSENNIGMRDIPAKDTDEEGNAS
ncbi:MAG TPA: hypothetical protein VGK16_14095 [Candidatus Limnocylindrales bacterium]